MADVLKNKNTSSSRRDTFYRPEIGIDYFLPPNLFLRSPPVHVFVDLKINEASPVFSGKFKVISWH